MQVDNETRADAGFEHVDTAAVGDTSVTRAWRSQVVRAESGLMLVLVRFPMETYRAHSEPSSLQALTVRPTGSVVATVRASPAGPFVARLGRGAEDQVQWSTLLAPIAVAQSVILSSRLLGPRSRVAVVARSRRLREVNGS